MKRKGQPAYTFYLNEEAHTEFIKKPINVQLPDRLYDSEHFELIKTCQIHTHYKTCRKHIKNKCRFSYGLYITENKVVAKRVHFKFSNDQKQEVLALRNTLTIQKLY